MHQEATAWHLPTPSSHAQGPFAAPGLSLLQNSSGTPKCREVLVSEKTLNTNIKAFEINYSRPQQKKKQQTKKHPNKK